MFTCFCRLELEPYEISCLPILKEYLLFLPKHVSIFFPIKCFKSINQQPEVSLSQYCCRLSFNYKQLYNIKS